MAVVAHEGVLGALEAHKALGRNEDVLLLADELDVAHELALKRRAHAMGRLMLGPGAGHARMGGLALGLANHLEDGPVGIVAASGGAARALGVQLARLGVGVRACLVAGRRDLTEDIGGLGAVAALERLRHDPQVRALVVVPWPAPDAEAADRVVSLAAGHDHPVVVCALGREVVAPPGVTVTDTVDDAAAAVARALGRGVSAPSAPRPRWVSGGLIRGLFGSGGLCAEAVWALRQRLERVATNVPGTDAEPLGGPGADRVHTCIDLGAPELRGARPHPVHDGTIRAAALAQLNGDHRVRVVLLDVTLGYGADPDPAGALAAPVRELLRLRPQVSVLAHIVGTERDPQGLAEQERRLADLGVRVMASSASAARLAAALVS